MNLTKNTILITGGTSGIGWVLGQKLLDMGNTVILLGRNKAKLEEAQNNGFHIIQCDLSNPADIENAVLHIQNNFTEINMLFNNAGV